MAGLVVLLRGVSGSGKSSARRNYFPNAVVCSADHHFLGEDRVYRFDRTKLGVAHAECKRKFREALSLQEKLIVVDNTNTTLREMQDYYDWAVDAGYEVEVITFLCDPYKAAERNCHGVSLDVILLMAQRLAASEIPSHWKQLYVVTS